MGKHRTTGHNIALEFERPFLFIITILFEKNLRTYLKFVFSLTIATNKRDNVTIAYMEVRRISMKGLDHSELLSNLL